MGGMRYDDLPGNVRREIELEFPAPDKPETVMPGRIAPDGVPDTNDPKNWMTMEEMQMLGIDPNDLTGKWKSNPGLQKLTPREFPLKQQPQNMIGPKLSQVELGPFMRS